VSTSVRGDVGSYHRRLRRSNIRKRRCQCPVHKKRATAGRGSPSCPACARQGGSHRLRVLTGWLDSSSNLVRPTDGCRMPSNHDRDNRTLVQCGSLLLLLPGRISSAPLGSGACIKANAASMLETTVPRLPIQGLPSTINSHLPPPTLTRSPMLYWRPSRRSNVRSVPSFIRTAIS
jgi:hypothetical protein